jgi:hypothetical protein
MSSNNDSIFSDDMSMKSCGSTSNRSTGSLNMDDHMAFFKKSNILRDNTRGINDNNTFKKTIIDDKHNKGEPGYFSQYDDLAYDNPGDPVSSNNVSGKTGKYANTSRLEMERDIALKGNYSGFDNQEDMTYGVVGDKDFVHNNMVPFFKRGTGKGYGQDSLHQQKLNDVKQRKLETLDLKQKDVHYLILM